VDYDEESQLHHLLSRGRISIGSQPVTQTLNCILTYYNLSPMWKYESHLSLIWQTIY